MFSDCFVSPLDVWVYPPSHVQGSFQEQFGPGNEMSIPQRSDYAKFVGKGAVRTFAYGNILDQPAKKFLSWRGNEQKPDGVDPNDVDT